MLLKCAIEIIELILNAFTKARNISALMADINPVQTQGQTCFKLPFCTSFVVVDWIYCTNNDHAIILS